jgi:hypothetical protein
VTSANARWESFLTALEERLEYQRSTFDQELYDQIEIMVPPEDLPPMPEMFAPRLAAAISESLMLENAVAQRLESVGRELATLPRNANRRPAVDAGRPGLLDTAL